MIVVKYCEHQFNVAKGSATLRLGTLNSYTSGSNSHLMKDVGEGTSVVTNGGRDFDLDPEAAEKLTGGLIAGGGISSRNGGNLVVRYQAPNCYVFCAATTFPPSIEQAQRIKPTYDDWYVLTDPDLFALSVSRLLSQQLRARDLDQASDAELDYLRNLRIQCMHGQVHYGERVQRLPSTENKSLSFSSNDFQSLVFRKTADFEEVPEYRFVFPIVDQYGNVVSVLPKWKDLRLKPDLGVETLTQIGT